MIPKISNMIKNDTKYIAKQKIIRTTYYTTTNNNNKKKNVKKQCQMYLTKYAKFI